MFEIKKMRIRAGLSQQQAADALEIKKARYGDWERETHIVNLRDAIRIADVFDCTLDELAGRDWPPPGSAATTAGMDARLARINEQYAEMNERGKVRATESVDDIHANPQNRAGVSPDAEAVAGAVGAA